MKLVKEILLEMLQNKIQEIRLEIESGTKAQDVPLEELVEHYEYIVEIVEKAEPLNVEVRSFYHEREIKNGK